VKDNVNTGHSGKQAWIPNSLTLMMPLPIKGPTPAALEEAIAFGNWYVAFCYRY